MTRDERRFIRREYINGYLQDGYVSIEFITYLVRLIEKMVFDYELRVYHASSK